MLGAISDAEVERERTWNVDAGEVRFPFSCLDDTDGDVRVLGETAKDDIDLSCNVQTREGY